MLSLYLNTPPQAQLEALRDPRAHGSDRFSVSSELAVSNSSSVFSPSMASSPLCMVGFGSLLRLLPFCPHPNFFGDPPSASSANPKSNSASDSVSRSPLLSYSLAWSFGTVGTVLPLKFGTSRSRNPSAPENCCNLSRPRGLVKMSAASQSVVTYRSTTSPERTRSRTK